MGVNVMGFERWEVGHAEVRKKVWVERRHRVVSMQRTRYRIHHSFHLISTYNFSRILGSVFDANVY